MTQIHVIKDGVAHHEPYALDRALFSMENKVESLIRCKRMLVSSKNFWEQKGHHKKYAQLWYH